MLSRNVERYLTEEEVIEYAEKRGVDVQVIECEMDEWKFRTFKDEQDFWGYILFDYSLAKDVVRSIAYEKIEHIEKHENIVKYIFKELGATVLNNGKIIYLY